MQINIIGSIILSLLSTLLFVILSFLYWQNIRSIKSFQKYILFGLRTFTLLFILFLILNPWLQWSKQIEVQENLSIYLDSSSSMQNQLAYDNIQISQLKSHIDNWSKNNNINTQWYLFGENIRKASIRTVGDFTDSLTDFSSLSDHAITNNGRQVILITDGQSNWNMDIKYLDFDEDLKINVIGVGSDERLNDIWIENIIAPSHVFIEDSVKIKIIIGYDLLEDANGELIFNIKHTDNHFIPVNIPLGKGFIDIEKSFLATQIIELTQIEVDSELIELNNDNNTNLIHIEVNDYKKGVLLVSGGLSPNTPLIKNLLTELPPNTLTHLYKKNNIEWNLNLSKIMKDSTIELVILDDFPGSKKDTQIYERIIENSLWEKVTKIYFEGPKSNANTAEILSKELGSSVRITDGVNNLKIDYFNDSSVFKKVPLSSIPPTKKQMIWESVPNNIIYAFNDNSAAIVNKNNFYGIFIKDSQEIMLSESKNSQSVLRNIFSNLLLHGFTGDKNLLMVTAEKQKYISNAPIIFNIEKSLILDTGLINISINSANGSTIKDISIPNNENNSLPQFIDLPGDYTAIASLVINDNQQIKSQPFYFRIIKNIIEEDNLFENKNTLESLAWKNRGTYSDPNHLDVVLSSVNSRPKSQLKEYKFSALSTQRYWWILIILLSIEWFLRKREGLL